MKVLIVNTSECTGGAAIAASRLVKALRANGIDAKMLVRDRKSDKPFVIGLQKGLRLKAVSVREAGDMV